jgi:histidinol-phosphate aminotransferase
LPEAFIHQLAGAIGDMPLNRYPDGQVRRLREDLAQHAGHRVEGTWVANGSNEIIEQLLLAYGGPGRSALVFDPTYQLHAQIAWITHTDVHAMPLEPPFILTDEQVSEAAAVGPEVVFVGSPNNPTGNLQPLHQIEAIASQLSDSLVIVDEAYIEFSPRGSALPLTKNYRNVAVVRTFSKAFALAGARIGYVLADREVVEDLQRVRLPYHLSALTQAAGLVALHHRHEASAIIESIRDQRERLLRELTSMEGVTAYPSDANFVLFVPPGDASRLWARMADKGVLVRDMTSVVQNSLRVTAGAEHEVDLFLKTLKEELSLDG